VVIGNAMSRGNPAMEHALDQRLPYTQRPAVARRRVLHRRRVLAVAGTHGKTTTTALLAWILDRLGREPGFLIGGVPQNFGVSARLGSGEDFVIEADEYDTAFFDKRSSSCTTGRRSPSSTTSNTTTPTSSRPGRDPAPVPPLWCASCRAMAG
jgi:UDP-N-acetylmuramate: L-alanyl-gamma-D-glutamyl-meso-diaminopimelate ligase